MMPSVKGLWSNLVDCMSRGETVAGESGGTNTWVRLRVTRIGSVSGGEATRILFL